MDARPWPSERPCRCHPARSAARHPPACPTSRVPPRLRAAWPRDRDEQPISRPTLSRMAGQRKLAWPCRMRGHPDLTDRTRMRARSAGIASPRWLRRCGRCRIPGSGAPSRGGRWDIIPIDVRRRWRRWDIVRIGVRRRWRRWDIIRIGVRRRWRRWDIIPIGVRRRCGRCPNLNSVGFLPHGGARPRGGLADRPPRGAATDRYHAPA